MKAHPNIHTELIDIVKKTMPDLAVIQVALGYQRAELMELFQSPDKRFCSFAARTQGKVETCLFTTTALC